MPMVVNTGVTNRNHTPGIYSAETTAALPAPGSIYVWVLDKQAGILYVDNGTALIPVLINAGSGGPFLPLAGGTMTGPIIGQDISARKFLPGSLSALVATTAANQNTADNLLDLFAQVSGSPSDQNHYILRGATPAIGAGTTTFVYSFGNSGTLAVLSDITTALAVYALLASPALTGIPTAPTAAPGTNTTQLATTAFVQAALPSVPVSSVFGRTGAVVAQAGDYAAFYLQLSGGTLTGILTAPSPVFTGIPVAPTAAAGTNTTQLATTAFVQAALPVGGPFLPLSGGTLTGILIGTTAQFSGLSGIGGGGALTLAPNTSATAANSFVLDNNGITYGGSASVVGGAFTVGRTVVDPTTGLIPIFSHDSITAVAANNAQTIFGADINPSIGSTNTKNFTGNLYSLNVGFSVINGATGIITKMVGLAVFVGNYAPGVTITNAIGATINAVSRTDGVTTNAVHLLLGTSTPPTGNFSIYYPGAFSNVLGTGRTIIGSLTDDGVNTLQVTGTVTTNGNTINGKTEIRGTNTTAMASTAFVQAAVAGPIVGNPTIAVTAAFGTGASANVSSNGKNLNVNLSPGTGVISANTLIATITLANAMSYNLNPMFSQANINAALVQGSANAFFMSSVTNNTIQITSGNIVTGIVAAQTLSYNVFI